MRASLGSGKTTLDTRILASLLMRVATESTLVDTSKIIIRLVQFCLTWESFTSLAVLTS